MKEQQVPVLGEGTRPEAGNTVATDIKEHDPVLVTNEDAGPCVGTASPMTMKGQANSCCTG